MTTTKPFTRNHKLHFPKERLIIGALKPGALFLKHGSQVPFTVIDPAHAMGVMCQQDGKQDYSWFDKSYPVTSLFVV